MVLIAVPTTFSYSIMIRSSPSTIWAVLTQPGHMKHWMGEPEMNLTVLTDWIVGEPISIKGFHHIPFENNGSVLVFEPHTFLSYSSLSSISCLPNQLENHSVISFVLQPLNDQTELTVSVSNFPSETIFKHLDFYWRTVRFLIKGYAENLEH
jgi:uncharacterized protein YndB with AHSA1/START domain